MPESDSNNSSDRRRARSRSLVIPLLFLGILLALCVNVYQFLQARRLEQAVGLMQKSTEGQFADTKEAISGVLEQNLLRYDELKKQLQTVATTTVEQARSEVKRSQSELAKTVERRHREVIAQLSDMRSDLREDTASKLAQISTNLQNTDSELKRVATSLDAPHAKPASSSPAPQAPAVVSPEPAAQKIAVTQKKTPFWSKINPFKSGKKKAEVSDIRPY